MRWALEAGYRHIDTAAAYGNERSVGDGIRQSGIARMDVFVTTKLWNEDMRQNRQHDAFLKSLELLRTDYVDLYLIHWPVAGKYMESWEVLIRLYEEGLVKAIGVSNFQAHHLDDIIRSTGVVPAVNQIEVHPKLTQVPLCEYCEKLGVVPEAWSPLGHGTLLSDEALSSIARRHGKSVAQVIIRWDLQRNIVTIPKSVNKKRITENAHVFDFELSDEDMAAIAALNCDERTGADPDHFSF